MCDGKQKYEDYKVDAVVSPQGAKPLAQAKRRRGSKNSPVDCFCVGGPSSGVLLLTHGVCQ
mgnify:CR=1 FL=1